MAPSLLVAGTCGGWLSAGRYWWRLACCWSLLLGASFVLAVNGRAWPSFSWSFFFCGRSCCSCKTALVCIFCSGGLHSAVLMKPGRAGRNCFAGVALVPEKNPSARHGTLCMYTVPLEIMSKGILTHFSHQRCQSVCFAVCLLACLFPCLLPLLAC